MQVRNVFAVYCEQETVRTKKTPCRINYKCRGQGWVVNQLLPPICNVPGGRPHNSEWHSVVSSLTNKQCQQSGVKPLYHTQQAKKIAIQTKLKIKIVANVCTERIDIYGSIYIFCRTDLLRKRCAMHQIFLSFIAKTKLQIFAATNSGKSTLN